MKKNENMILFAAILFVGYFLVKKKESPYPKWWDKEADDFLDEVKNFLQETK